MGKQQVTSETAAELRQFTLAMLDDIDALEELITGDHIETDVRRIGAEQELFLVDRLWRAAPIAMEMLEELDDPQFTTELGLYNLEINLDPLTYGGRCFSNMLAGLEAKLAKARDAAGRLDATIALAGILPTLRKSDLGLHNLTPLPRYRLLNESMNALRGGPWRLSVKGIDELASRHDSVMLESCCTSFQAHLQVTPDEFAPLYNLAQAITAPVLAASVNSAMLFGRRLWHETRIPLFQQSIDTRRTGDHLREASPRVRFGEHWLDDSILEMFREDVVRFRSVFGAAIKKNPFEQLADGDVPHLTALRAHNGTIYRWNRGCYGVLDGKPHLRIEMRALPSGPSAIDEVANMAFAFGLVLGLRKSTPDVRRVLRFDDAKANFAAAATHGLHAQMTWWGGRRLPARELILEILLPIARQGLIETGVDSEEADRFLEVIQQRVTIGQTGARWLLGSFARLSGRATREQIVTALTTDMVRNQLTGEPVHTWELAEVKGARTMDLGKLRVEEIMTSELYTLGPDEPVDLAGKIMQWKKIRHIPVEDKDQRVIGLLSSFDVLRFLGQRGLEKEATAIAEVMMTDPPTIAPEAPIGMALSLMRERGADCLPVVKKGRLVGIVTERDFLRVVSRQLELPPPESA